MRLLNAKTLNFKVFIAKYEIPPYAILSHTWGDDEPKFGDIFSTSKCDNDPQGVKKIRGCCEQALRDGWQWVWIDTVCIDKTSSAELSEAINSMFEWYENSRVCYVLLADVPTPRDLTSRSEQDRNSEFHRSRWFRRGWTLQELIAPYSIEFYSASWDELGTKRSLESALVARTGIRYEVLRKEMALEACSAAEKMSWASSRNTTREEDAAYSLLGIFNVNMPLLYGEGKVRAFRRLQLEILSKTDDYSLLAWSNDDWYFGYSDCFERDEPAVSVLAGNLESFRANTVFSKSRVLEALKLFPTPGLDVKQPSYIGVYSSMTFTCVRPSSHPEFTAEAREETDPSRNTTNNASKLWELLKREFQQFPTITMTNRGLRLRVLARTISWKRPERCFLVWTFSVYPEGFVCVFLQQSNSSDPDSAIGRVAGVGLVLVSFDQLDTFKAQEMLLLTSDKQVLRSGWERPGSYRVKRPLFIRYGQKESTDMHWLCENSCSDLDTICIQDAHSLYDVDANYGIHPCYGWSSILYVYILKRLGLVLPIALIVCWTGNKFCCMFRGEAIEDSSKTILSTSSTTAAALFNYWQPQRKELLASASDRASFELPSGAVVHARLKYLDRVLVYIVLDSRNEE